MKRPSTLATSHADAHAFSQVAEVIV